MYDTYSDEFGMVDFQRSQHGSGMSQRSQVWSNPQERAVFVLKLCTMLAHVILKMLCSTTQPPKLLDVLMSGYQVHLA